MATEVKDLSNYHRVLKQFLDISSDNLTPVTSSRVTKAREKLCRLTPSQFYDLSTDVYDELQRRINETNSKPEFLLPKAKFHPKRNQARQKLASLPSPRFKDLVNDVLYEIERRDYRIVGYDINESQNFGRKKSSSSSKKENHEIIDNKENELNNKKISVNNIKQQNVQEHQPFKDDPYSENINKNRLSTNDVSINPDSNSIDNNQTPSKSEIKPSTVFPKKSELTWSSDEEDEGDEHKVVSNLPKLSAYETPEPVIPISTTQNGLQSKSLKPHNSTDTNDGVSTAIAGATSISQNDANNRSIDYDTSPLPKRESRRSSTKSKELKLLMEESAKMDQTITDLENELKSVNQKNRSLDDENENYQNEISNLNLQLENFKNLNNDYKELDNENLILKQKIEELDNENLILKQKIEELNQFKLENSEKFENYDSINNNYITLNENFKSLSSENSKLLETNNSLKQEIEKLKLSLQESNSKNIDTNNDDKGVNVITNPIQEKSKVDDILPEMAESNEALSSQLGDLKQQANEYKQRYEALRSNQIFELLNDKLPKLKDIDLLADDTGLIPLQLVANLYSSVESLLIYINGSDINVNSLFDLMASVISSAHSIVSEVKNDTSSSYLSGNSSNISSPKTPIDDNDLNSVTLYRCKAIESSISNSLTCTRYFAIYKDFVPKLSLEVSVNDIYFSVCELINIVKVNHNKIPKMRFKNSPLLQQINDANISGNRSLVGEGLLNTEDTAIKTESNALNPEINAIKNEIK
ncbi:unnamed protein product [[Candida] boidinii]|uniref:Unnamed protein product n=1 Tax=Candida boidinii TaxID=5477 RepID=A0A9W6WFB6_CANBO|nr:unnamed protein product [[Candida] boidinii]